MKKSLYSFWSESLAIALPAVLLFSCSSMTYEEKITRAKNEFIDACNKTYDHSLAEAGGVKENYCECEWNVLIKDEEFKELVMKGGGTVADAHAITLKKLNDSAFMLAFMECSGLSK